MSDSIDNQLEYQEQVLEDLDEIKGSLSDEENENSEEYQKKVLGSLRSLEKSVQALSDDSVTISLSGQINRFRIRLYNDYFNIVSDNSYRIERYDVSNIDKFYIESTQSGFYSCVLTNQYTINAAAQNIPCKAMFEFTSSTTDIYEVLNYSNARYFLISKLGDNSFPISVYYLKSENPNAPEQGTIEQIDYSEPLDTLIQISTFQGFASALLTGILLFLIFVKGLRR